MSKTLKDKTILYIVHNYSSFQKDPIEEASKYFKKVYVLVRYKPLSRFVKLFRIKWLQKYADSYCLDLRGLPKNVEVIKTPVWYLPYGFLNKMLGYLHYRSVKRAIKKYDIKFDLVHSHFIWSSGYVGMRLKQDYGVPFIVTGHGYDVYVLPYRNSSWRNKIKEILYCADLILTVSEYNKSKINGIGINHNKIEVISNGFPKGLFKVGDKKAARRKVSVPQDSIMVLTVGNLVDIKGHRFLIEAMKDISKISPKILCFIVGQGPKKTYLERLINKYKLTNSVYLAGLKPHNEIPFWMNAADLFVLPSLNEGGPVVILEALASGIPVVATNVGNVKQVVRSSKIGYICKTSDINGLKSCIIRAISHSWDRKYISRTANGFSWDRVVIKIIKAYENLLERNLVP